MNKEEFAERLADIEIAIRDAIPEWATSGEVVTVLTKIASDISFDATKRNQVMMKHRKQGVRNADTGNPNRIETLPNQENGQRPDATGTGYIPPG